MKFRELIAKLEAQGELQRESSPLALQYQLAHYLYHHQEAPTVFTAAAPSPWQVVAGIYSQRRYLAAGLEIPLEKMLPALAHAFAHPGQPAVVATAPCQEIIHTDVDLKRLPIPHFFPQDGGAYITAGIMIIKDPETGHNASYHRLMRIDANSFTLRMVENRQAHTSYLKANRRLPAAICLGNSAAVMLAASMSPPSGVFELAIADALDPTPLVAGHHQKELLIPADCEVVLEGEITAKTSAEGPFVDLTTTYDFVRQQPVLRIDCITHRRHPLFQILLPGQREHRLLMGMPKEPSIFSFVNERVRCCDVVLTNGGGCWLHAVVQIAKQDADDGRKAITAAFAAHPSLKHVVVVDSDIDIHNPHAVEWALATRFQADKDLLVLHDQPASSLDPSARHIPGQKTRSAKLGFDATCPLREAAARFQPVAYVESAQ